MTGISESVRRARAGDGPDIYRLARLFTPRIELDAADFEENFQSLIHDSRWFICVVESDGQLVGYAAAQNYGRAVRTSFTVGRLHDLYVEADARRRGTGKKLVEEVFRWARQRTVPMILDWQATPESVAFYESFGLEADYAGDFPQCPGFSLDLRLKG